MGKNKLTASQVRQRWFLVCIFPLGPEDSGQSSPGSFLVYAQA